MQVTVETGSPLETRADLLALGLPEAEGSKWRLSSRAKAVDRELDGAISAVLASGDFRGKAEETLVLYPKGGIAAKRLLLLGVGPEASLDSEALRRAAGTAVRQGAERKAKRVAFVPPPTRRVRGPLAAQALAEGAILGAYRFEDYRSKSENGGGEVESICLLTERTSELRAARAAARTGVILAESQNVARDLSNEPANALPPATLGHRAEKLAKEVGLRCKVFEVAELRRRKMGAILAVGGGSAHPPRLIVLEHNAPKPRKGKTRGKPLPTVCIVGKGVTFDSGGISIKPAAGMDEMKHDMSGAASVVGAMRAVALLGLPLHVVGVIGAAENMPSGTAYRPGDIVTSQSKKTIEVMNTDAEGRVVLADALHFARTEYEPVAMVDLATLTGACVVALGKAASGLFATNERLGEHIRRAGETTGEKVWPMPLWDEHRRMVRSEVADLKNAAGRDAGSSTAAAFLAAFAGDTPWVHLDIAGTAWVNKAGPAYQPRGATGVGVRLLLEMLRTWKGSRVV